MAGKKVKGIDSPFNFFSVVLKMGIIGDAQIGKTSLMIKYAEGAYDTEYIQTLGNL